LHDYFDILGLARDARPNDIRRACGRRVHASHPDIRDGDAAGWRAGAPAGDRPGLDEYDAAIDFVDATAFVSAMRSAFFA
jgi:curved DNA-binding protein CbpA